MLQTAMRRQQRKPRKELHGSLPKGHGPRQLQNVHPKQKPWWIRLCPLKRQRSRKRFRPTTVLRRPLQAMANLLLFQLPFLIPITCHQIETRTGKLQLQYQLLSPRLTARTLTNLPPAQGLPPSLIPITLQQCSRRRLHPKLIRSLLEIRDEVLLAGGSLLSKSWIVSRLLRRSRRSPITTRKTNPPTPVVAISFFLHS